MRKVVLVWGLAVMLRGIVREALRHFGEARQALTKETDAARMPRPLWGLAYILVKTPNVIFELLHEKPPQREIVAEGVFFSGAY